MARKRCKVCLKNWPADSEFYRKSGSLKCIACEVDSRSPRKPLTPEQRERKLKYAKQRRIRNATARTA